MVIVNMKYLRGAFPEDAAYVGRWMPKLEVSMTYVKFGNPFRLVLEQDRGTILADYFGYLLANEQLVKHARVVLAGKKYLACWCATKGGIAIDADLVCHAQVLARAIRGDYDGHYT
jgi:hypothetical protein